LIPTRRTLIAALPLLLIVACDRDPGPASTSAPTPPQPLGPMMPASELAERLADVKAGKLVVFYVGPAELFPRGRVPGARLLPETGTEAGRSALVRAVEQTPVETEIVVYCGCCPYRSCGNVRPASEVLRASGRSNAKYLDMPTNFKTDWTNKGYPVERG
jgi:hypothetical protein